MKYHLEHGSSSVEPRGRRWTVAAALAAVVCLASGDADALLSYTLPDALKKTSCAGDTDSDCLDNNREVSLAWALAPHYFYDEGENCSAADDGLHYSRKDFYQVRPNGSSVSAWANNSTAKWVTVTYYLLHPHDCQSHGFIVEAGHQGDSESVRFWLYSYNLTTWYVSSARYWRHGNYNDWSGSYLEARAIEIGSIYPSVAADEDGHGSWPGRQGSSSHCAGSEDDWCAGFCDCFVGTMDGAHNNGDWEYVGVTRNIGGPSPETWGSVLSTDTTGHKYSVLDVGHGTGTSNREYWTNKGGSHAKFCGWECSSRKTDGNCNTSAHQESDCVSSLYSKLDTASFSVGGGGGCSAGKDGRSSALNALLLGGALLVLSLWRRGSARFGRAPLRARPPLLAGLVTSAAFLLGACEGDLGPSGVAQSRARVVDRLAATRADSPAERAPVGEPQLDAAPVAASGSPDDEARRRRELEADPVASLAPMLGEMDPAQQLATLKWMRTVPGGKIASAFPDLIDAAGIAHSRRQEIALDRVDALIELLELDGFRAPEPAPGTVSARIDAAAPPPGRPPIELLETYRPDPSDPFAMPPVQVAEFLEEARRARQREQAELEREQEQLERLRRQGLLEHREP